MDGAIAIGVGIVVLVLLTLKYTQSNRDDAEKELLRLCRGDKEMVERLIALEKRRGKSENRRHAAKAAVYSFKRDNR